MSTERVSEAAVMRSVSATLRGVVLPAVDEGTASGDEAVRASIVQLISLVEHVAARPADAAQRRLSQLIAALDDLASNEIVASVRSVEPVDVASAALVASIGRIDDAADEVRAALRPLLVAHLDDELASTMPLIDAFRGNLRDA